MVCCMSATAQRRRRFRALRANADLTQRMAAKKAKIGHDRYWKIENGWADPTPEEVANLARVFKTDPGTVFPEQSSEAVAS